MQLHIFYEYNSYYLDCRIGLNIFDCIFEKKEWSFNNTSSIKYFKNGELESLGDKPASIFKEDGYRIEKWYSKGRLHRYLDPAEVVYKNGIVFKKAWYVNREKHRAGDQPAVIYYNSDGSEGVKECWYKGRRVPSPEDRERWRLQDLGIIKDYFRKEIPLYRTLE